MEEFGLISEPRVSGFGRIRAQIKVLYISLFLLLLLLFIYIFLIKISLPFSKVTFFDAFKFQIKIIFC